MIVLAKAVQQPVRQLILVRYSPDHIDRGDECVCNSADIDTSQIVWARDMGEPANRELVNYYRGTRKIWLYQPDIDPAKLAPYELTSQVRDHVEDHQNRGK